MCIKNGLSRQHKIWFVIFYLINIPPRHCETSNISGCVARFDITALIHVRLNRFIDGWQAQAIRETICWLPQSHERLAVGLSTTQMHVNSSYASHPHVWQPYCFGCLAAHTPCWPIFKEYNHAIACDAHRLIACCWWTVLLLKAGWVVCRDFMCALLLLKCRTPFHTQIKPRP